LGRPSQKTRAVRPTTHGQRALQIAHSTNGYNDWDELVSYTHDGFAPVTWGYNGLVVTKTDESGRVTTTSTDSRGRVLKQTAQITNRKHPRHFGCQVHLQLLRRYDQYRLCRANVADSSGATDITYDLLGRADGGSNRRFNAQ